jgi:glycosyltransferase involved in cell wall biosynthesis
VNLKQLHPVRLLFTTFHLDQGGVEQVILTYAGGLDRQKYRITVVCLEGGTVATEIGAIAGVDLIVIQTRSRLKRLLEFIAVARKAKPDVVHNHACWYGLLVGWFVGVRRVETVHNVYHWLNWHERLRYGLYLRLADRIIAVSEAVSEFTRSYFPFVPSARMTVIFNGIDPSRFQVSARLEDMQEFGLHHKTVIGFLGRLTEQKGLSYLLSAAAEIGRMHPEAQFMIVGDGELGRQLREKVVHEELTNVLFTGFQRDVPRFLSLFDIFVLPSQWEGLPALVEPLRPWSKASRATLSNPAMSRSLSVG